MHTFSFLKRWPAALILFLCMSFTLPGKWQKLGEKKVDYLIDHDVLNVSFRDGTFESLRLVVRNGSLNMHRCVIHFSNGEEQNIELKHTFQRGSISRLIDLKGNRRFIDRISFWYDTKNYSNNKAVVSVWGK